MSSTKKFSSRDLGGSSEQRGHVEERVEAVEGNGGVIEDSVDDNRSEISNKSDESTNNNKKGRVRHRMDRQKAKPKRRRTSETEESDVSENAQSDRGVDLPGEHLPGTSRPVSLNLQPNTDKDGVGVSGPVYPTRDEDNDDDEMELENPDKEDDSDSDDLNIESGRTAAKAATEHGLEYVGGGRSKGFGEEVSTTTNRFKTQDLKDEQGLADPVPSTSRGLNIQHRSASEAKSNPGLDELFRVPIFEAESRRGFEKTTRNITAAEQLELNSRQKIVEEINTNPSPSVFRFGGIFSNFRSQNKEDQAQDNKRKTIWARKLFFSTAELIFPGFTDSHSVQNQFMAVKVRSSWVLQALLYADILYFLLWVASFLSTYDITISVLKELHGNLILYLTALFSFVNIPRLIFGLRGNENDKMELLALFWMMTLIVQVPLFGFIFLTDVFTPVRLAFTVSMDSMMMIFIVTELIVGTYHLKNLIRDELKIVDMTRRPDENLEQPVELGQYRPRVINSVDGPVVDWVNGEDNNDQDDDANPPQEDEDEDGWSTDDSDNERSRGDVRNDGELDYQVNIRRLRPEDMEDEPERDDSNIVSSTSDAVRHRPIRV